MSSYLYRCHSTHVRFSPKIRSFTYKLFNFWLDLDALEETAKKLPFVSVGRWNLFSFYHSDHQLGGAQTLQESLRTFLREQGIQEELPRAFAHTNLRVLGYVFNPVSFFYVHGISGDIHCIIEITNTYLEKKRFYAGIFKNQEDTLLFETLKYFYISPFLPMDSKMRFKLSYPSTKAHVHVEDFIGDQKILMADLRGQRELLTTSQLLKFFFCYPLVTLKIILAIHWQALQIYLRGIPYFKKNQDMHLQKGFTKCKN